MAKTCIECGKRKWFFAMNYAGLNVRDGAPHAFPSRISDITLPGLKDEDFLCAQCANKRRVVCDVHGTIEEDFCSGRPPTCWACSEEKEGRIHVHFPYGIQGHRDPFSLKFVERRASMLLDDGFTVCCEVELEETGDWASFMQTFIDGSKRTFSISRCPECHASMAFYGFDSSSCCQACNYIER